MDVGPALWCCGLLIVLCVLQGLCYLQDMYDLFVIWSGDYSSCCDDVAMWP